MMLNRTVARAKSSKRYRRNAAVPVLFVLVPLYVLFHATPGWHRIRYTLLGSPTVQEHRYVAVHVVLGWDNVTGGISQCLQRHMRAKLPTTMD